MASTKGHWFITGATGFIGRELLRRLLTDSDDEISILLRPGSAQSVQGRAEALLRSLKLDDSFAARLHPLSGDVSEPGLGLDPESRSQVLSRSTRIVHLAADTRFHNTLQRARAANVDGVRNVLHLARELRGRGRLRGMAHVSTAYVAGARTDLVGSEDLRPQGPFRNTYEQSKCEAEQLVRSHMTDLPIVVFRPSIVVGHSRTGEAVGGNTIYWALKQYLRGRRTFFARSDTPLDLVPVDYVVDAMLHIVSRDAGYGRTVPLVAGAGAELALGELANAAADFFGDARPRLLPPALLACTQGVLRLLLRTERQRRFVDNMLSYLPYFSDNPRFAFATARELLAGSGIEAPDIHDYLPTLLAFCTRQGWSGESARTRRAGTPETGVLTLVRTLGEIARLPRLRITSRATELNG